MEAGGGSTLVEFVRYRAPLSVGALRERSGAVLPWLGVVLCSLSGAGCGAANHPATTAAPRLLDRSGPGHRLRSVAWSRGGVLVALNQPAPTGHEPAVQGSPAQGSIEAPERWTTVLSGAAGPLAASDDRILGTEQVEPGTAAALLLDPVTGQITRRIPILSTDFVTIAEVAVCDSGAVLAGSFDGTLRVGDQLVSTGGQRDGFVAKVDAAGVVTALLRMGGDGDDALTAAACRGDQVAIAGTFSEGAELRGVELQRIAASSAAPDAMVALLRGTAGTAGLSVSWQRSFGGSKEDLAAGLAITSTGELAVVGMARGELVVGAQTLEIGGLADGYLARWSATGEALGVIRLGGADYDATTRVTALGDRLAIAGFFSGSLELGGAVTAARGGDDAMLIVVDRDGSLHPLAVSGEGREEIVGLAAAPPGLVLGVVHTGGVQAFGLTAAAPSDPLGGGAVLVVPAL